MKVKMKFDLASIKSWLFEHGEKVAFGTMVLVFLMFAYSALQREVLDPTKGETKLSEQARAVTEHVSKSAWDVKNAEVQIVDYKERAKRDPVPAEAFATNKPYAWPIFDPKGKRDDPELFGIEEPRASAGVGIFALKGAAAAPAAGAGAGGQGGGRADARKGGGGVQPSTESKLTSQAWVVVTALVPVEKQSAEYNRVFSHAMGESAERDTPHYTRPIVERAQVDAKNPDKLDWKPLEPLTVDQPNWQEKSEEIVEAKYLDPNLTFRLGPLVGASWNESVTHPKLRPNEVSHVDEAAAPAAPAVAAADAVAGAAKPAAAPARSAHAITHKLLRVFDYTVQPNGRYRYRLKLELKNPNFGMNAKFLKNPAAPLNAQEVRAAEKWSDPTEVIAVPSGYEVLAGNVEFKSVEPYVNLMVTALNRDDGIAASTKTRMYRASLANKKESKVLAIDPRNKKVIHIDEVDFNSGVVVVDIFGGKNVSLPKRRESPLSAPGEVLLLDAQGNLTIHNDLEDHAQYLYRQPPAEAEAASEEPEKTSDDKAKKAPRASKSGR
jgi:hypothetical protein